MAIKLLLLKSGEDVIADVKEMVVEDKVVGYILHHPARAKLIGDSYVKEGNDLTPFKLQLTPWMPLSKDKKVPLVADWVVTITEPVDQLSKMYSEGVEQYENREFADSDSDIGEGASDSD